MESVNGKYYAPVDDPAKAAMFDTEEEAARAYDIVARELFKHLNLEKAINAVIEPKIMEHSDGKALACTICQGLVFTTFGFADNDDRLCWDCFDEVLTDLKAQANGIVDEAARRYREGQSDEEVHNWITSQKLEYNEDEKNMDISSFFDKEEQKWCMQIGEKRMHFDDHTIAIAAYNIAVNFVHGLDTKHSTNQEAQRLCDDPAFCNEIIEKIENQ